MRCQTSRFGLAGAILAIAVAGVAPAAAVPISVGLQNATATHSNIGPGYDFDIAYTIDGLTSSNGWALYDVPANSSNAETAVFETQNDAGFSSGTALSFRLDQWGTHPLGRFRLSVTTDDRSTFADGLAIDGDVDANWIVLNPLYFASSEGGSHAVETDHSIYVSGTIGHPQNTYIVYANTRLSNITGIRLEALEDSRLPTDGPGRAHNGNIVLTEFVVSAEALTPTLLIQDSSDSFGAVRVGSGPRVGAGVAVLNNGEVESVLHYQATIPLGAFSVASPSGSVVAEEVAGQVGTAFNPTARGSYLENLSFTSNGGSDSVALSGMGVGPVYESNVAPGGVLDLGSVPNGDAEGASLQVGNGSLDVGFDETLTGLSLLSASFTGTDASLFSLTGFTPGMVLNPGDVSLLGVSFAGSTIEGSKTATLSIQTDQNAAFGALGDIFSYTITADVAAPLPTGPGTFEEGDQLQFSYYHPDKNTLYHSGIGDRPGVLEPIVTVGEGAEIADFPLSLSFPLFEVDLEAGKIILTVLKTFPLGAIYDFSGIRVSDVTGTLDAFESVVVVDGETTQTDFDMTHVSFTDDLIFLDMQGVSLTQGLKIVVLVNVPEPASISLLVVGLSLLLHRMRGGATNRVEKNLE